MEIEDVRIGMGVVIVPSQQRGRVVDMDVDDNVVWVRVDVKNGYDEIDVDPSELVLED